MYVVFVTAALLWFIKTLINNWLKRF